MGDGFKDLMASMANIKPRPNPIKETVYLACVLVFYSLWGLLSSAILLNSGVVRGQVLRSLLGIVFAGILPASLHVYEARQGKVHVERGTWRYTVTIQTNTFTRPLHDGRAFLLFPNVVKM
jgi:hypothetical protein